jgi:hypothetical protein
MNLYADSTTIQFSGGSSALFGDAGVLSEGETPLLGLDEEAILVNPSVIRTYQRIIFQLEAQVFHYKTLFSQLSRRPAPSEEIVELSTPINQASVRTLNSILQARISAENILRVFDEEEI